MALWSGRFNKKMNKKVAEFTASLPFDVELHREDIEGSIAYAKMLAKTKIISGDEAKQIVKGLREIEKDIESGQFLFDLADEDIHLAIERALIEKLGPVGGKLHTGRSRNDQIATDMRLFIKKEALEIDWRVFELQKTLLILAEENLEIIMPGYTHLQVAQPILFSHYLLAYFWMLERDFRRFKCCYNHSDWLPLGSGALAGTTFPLDRQFLADELGFEKIIPNSVDAVSDRDFVLLFHSMSSLLMIHLSRLCEELILWSTTEFGFIELDDAYATGSSIMPQKKNPDVAELIRGKSGRIFGHLVQMLTTMKGLPLAYNRDLQEDKEGLFDAVETVKSSLEVLSGMLMTMEIKVDKMKQAAERSFANATDVADYLVDKGMSFREAHEAIGKLVKYCLKQGKARLADLTLAEFKKASALISEDVYQVISIENCVARRNSAGGTSPEQVIEQLKQAKKVMETETAWLKDRTEGSRRYRKSVIK